MTALGVQPGRPTAGVRRLGPVGPALGPDRRRISRLDGAGRRRAGGDVHAGRRANCSSAAARRCDRGTRSPAGRGEPVATLECRGPRRRVDAGRDDAGRRRGRRADPPFRRGGRDGASHLEGHRGPVVALAYGPGGRLLASASTGASVATRPTRDPAARANRWPSCRHRRRSGPALGRPGRRRAVRIGGPTGAGGRTRRSAVALVRDRLQPARPTRRRLVGRRCCEDCGRWTCLPGSAAPEARAVLGSAGPRRSGGGRHRCGVSGAGPARAVIPARRDGNLHPTRPRLSRRRVDPSSPRLSGSDYPSGTAAGTGRTA